MGKDAERYKKIQKDRKRYEKMGKDSGCIVERRFSRDVANARVLLNRRIPYLGGRGLCQICFWVLVLFLSVVEALSTL